MRNRFSFVFVWTLAAVLACPGFVFAQQGGAAKLPPGGAPGRAAETARSARIASPTRESIRDDVAEALAVIREQHADGLNLKYDDAFKSSISGALHSLDPHSTYLDRADLEKFMTEQRSEYYGIGATIGDLRDGGSVNTFIRATFDNSPAQRAGLRYGDRVVEVDGQSMRGKPYGEVREKLIGPRGTKVRVTVEHAATGQSETVEITRAAVPLPSIPEVYMLRPGVGYIAMTGGFNTTTADEFNAALEYLHGKGMNQLVLDLRGNGGGLLVQAVRIADIFLHKGQMILTQRGRIRGSSQQYIADNTETDRTPLVILVNRGTASASEILAGALQDHDRALVVGETTFGKGLVQLPFELEYGSAMLLTIAKYYTPSGRLIQRDYSNGALYDYYTQGGTARLDKQAAPPQRPAGPEKRTDTGRVVYGGGGITPDETVPAAIVSAAQARLLDPVFDFAVQLAAGHIAGFEPYKVSTPIDFKHDLLAGDIPVTDALFKKFREFAASKPAYKVSPALLDRERAFVVRQLRYELATASYGSIMALRVFNEDDPQLARAITVLPRARDLAQAAMRARQP
ncbi:MAG: S41 family peptidase [Acidobacteria bacterium]|nr:S41 family peptidase [Acidobacteriota bacterium]